MHKTISFAAIHFSIAFGLAWLFTGSMIAGGLLALVEPLCNTAAFHIHEKWWAQRHSRRAMPVLPQAMVVA